ncbi:heme-binding-like protein At3g10130, chloroplastic [Cyclospora cayetanensis]|uniref:Uncharacterized protein n=2 Tax=Cyclospora cayetanensis TaxID=88456 RepID=A0A1D3CSD8_9EIME|nr:heme-binding-like protein At3g10130, chloroplastic [Cyclospora cayetanensis]OEH74100.1 hypothetical protein cyc_00022 [Cyclospora cayetanensis]
MGSVVGRTSTEILPYEVIKDAPAYEIRLYNQHPVVQAEWQADSRSTFFTLADYIGAFDVPKNSESKKIAMTAPVECLANGDKFSFMRFFPPQEFDTAESMPAPVSSAVTVQPLPKRFVAARRFSGSVDLNNPKTDPSVRPQMLHLIRALLNDGFIKSDEPCDTDEAVWQQLDKGHLRDGATGDVMQWSLAVYDRPLSIPFFRRNEIWIWLSPDVAERVH